MGHTFTNHLYHILFSTKGRRAFIKPALKPRLLDYMGAVARNKGGAILSINAVPDHVHFLARIKPSIAASDFVGAVKANSSKWVSQTFPAFRRFEWQAGYSSFTVSESNWRKVAAYIERQEEHHRAMPFEEELAKLLEKHGIEFDPAHYLD